MLANLQTINTLSNKSFTKLKYFYKVSLINQIFKTNGTILVYYYDFLDAEALKNLNQSLIEEKYKSIRLKKNLLIAFAEHRHLNFLINLLKNNILLIYSQNNQDLNKSIIMKLNKIKNIHFLGGFFNKKFLRPSEIQKLLNLTISQINRTTSFLFKKFQYSLQQTISLKKY